MTTPSKLPKLKPCPFCGHAAAYNHLANFVQCTNMDCYTWNVIRMPIKEWNRRAKVQP